METFPPAARTFDLCWSSLAAFRACHRGGKLMKRVHCGVEVTKKLGWEYHSLLVLCVFYIRRPKNLRYPHQQTGSHATEFRCGSTTHTLLMKGSPGSLSSQPRTRRLRITPQIRVIQCYKSDMKNAPVPTFFGRSGLNDTSRTIRPPRLRGGLQRVRVISVSLLGTPFPSSA